MVSRSSLVLILGSMPGPEALRKQQYYGFNGNHFWTILPRLFNEEKPATYLGKLALAKRHRIALWDVLASCIRPGALDSAIKKPELNRIPELLQTYRNIRAVFVNGRYAHDLFVKYFDGQVDRPVFYLPSTSPANAAMSIDDKIKKWSLIKDFIENEDQS